MNVLFAFSVTKTPLSIDMGYGALLHLIEALKPLLPGVRWYFTPATAEESKLPWISVEDRGAFLARSMKEYAETLREWPEYPFGFTAVLSSASDEQAFKIKEGRCSLTFSPGHGRIQLEILKPDLAWPQRNVTEMMKNILSAVIDAGSVEFASVDVEQAPRRDGQRGTDSFSFDFRTFPHRQFLGWMGFVPKVLTPQDIPQAAEVIPLPEKHGSVVVAVDDTFDVHNPEHIKRAQQVEMRLVDLDALPVIDPSFK